MNKFLKLMLILTCCSVLWACTTSSGLSVINASQLQQGKRLFNAGLYKRSMHVLLPLATDGIADAQYAIGYMYYYGYGVNQDTDTGYFWIKRAANKGFQPAIHALETISKQGGPG